MIFDAVKATLKYSPLLSPLDYTWYFILYVMTSDSTIIMVMFQGYDSNQEDVICYLIKGIIGTELHYSHVDKLALVVVHVVQQFQCYILM